MRDELNQRQTDLYEKYQEQLLWVFNTKVGRAFLGLGYEGTIVKFYPHAVHIAMGFVKKDTLLVKAKFRDNIGLVAKLYPLLKLLDVSPQLAFSPSLAGLIALVFTGDKTNPSDLLAIPPVFLVTDTFTSDTADGGILASDSGSNYASARAGTSSLLSLNATTDIRGHVTIGQSFGQEFSGPNNYYLHEGFLKFDTSTIDDAAVVSVAILETTFDASRDNEGGGWFAEARIHNWGATLAIADFVPGATLSSKTKVATLAYASMTGTVDWVSETAFISNIDKTGFTFILLNAKDMTDNYTPTAARDARIFSGDHGTAANRPHLEVTYTTHTESQLRYYRRTRFPGPITGATT